MSVNPTHKPQRNTAKRAEMLTERRRRQKLRDDVIGYVGVRFTPVPKDGWRERVRQTGELRKIA